MDKDLIRIMIFAIGLLVVLGMVAWSYLQHEKFRQDLDDYGDDVDDDVALDEEDEFGLNALNEQTTENDYYQSHDKPVQPTFEEPTLEAEAQVQYAESAVTAKKPSLVQFSIMARTKPGFNGVELFEILHDVGLEYGSLQIFERLDAGRLVDFGVASMVKPGTFPSTQLAAFYCPGIVFFMQPDKVDNPVAVFDDFVRTFNFVALRLEGQMLNQNRELLTDEDIDTIRQALLTN